MRKLNFYIATCLIIDTGANFGIYLKEAFIKLFYIGRNVRMKWNFAPIRMRRQLLKKCAKIQHFLKLSFIIYYLYLDKLCMWKFPLSHWLNEEEIFRNCQAHSLQSTRHFQGDSQLLRNSDVNFDCPHLSIGIVRCYPNIDYYIQKQVWNTTENKQSLTLQRTKCVFRRSKKTSS